MQREVERNADTDFFVTADNDAILQRLSARFPNRCHVYTRETSRETSRMHPRGLQEDLIELLLLARSPLIIGSYLSTFTEVAWWLGDARARVVVL
jgi:hypothetical protein